MGLVFGLLAAVVPIAILRGRAIRRLREHAELWPDAVDNLASAVRAGLSLPESLVQLGERGPEGLREPVEALYFPVRLGPVGPGLLGGDTELEAGLLPEVGLVGRSVVGKHPA